MEMRFSKVLASCLVLASLVAVPVFAQEARCPRLPADSSLH